MLRDYARLTLFMCMVLLGIQIPGFLELYQQRLQAHVTEARHSLSGFQQTADRHFDGNLAALVEYYRSSSDAVFREDANSLAVIIERVLVLESEMAAMDSGQFGQIAHLMTRADQSLRADTLAHYQYRVILNPAAIGWGLGIALLLSLLVEGVGRLLWPRRRHHRHRPVYN
ncbi:DUF2937 family protein [Ferrimonas marina]|uniref:DUF2937 domain-containing protein n=1 Tax=Ferrimonas marina TaxID=299255 RepID=A0A1M5ZG11_9GAMM|nr:DUF2937 family protein [Ferrimonas marina]SHI22833.1 Protein of unknown function [Ferrimonas marina]